MRFKDIAENLRTTGRKYRWGRHRLCQWQEDRAPSYCALGIKAHEFGVSNLILAYAQRDGEIAAYKRFSLERVYLANDQAYSYENAISVMEALETLKEAKEPDIEGWVEYLKTLEPAARKWAQMNGYHSLLTQPGGGA